MGSRGSGERLESLSVCVTQGGAPGVQNPGRHLPGCVTEFLSVASSQRVDAEDRELRAVSGTGPRVFFLPQPPLSFRYVWEKDGLGWELPGDPAAPKRGILCQWEGDRSLSPVSCFGHTHTICSFSQPPAPP